MFSSTVSALEFTAEFSPAQQTIAQYETAVYDVTIYHSYPELQFFEVYSPEVLWDIRTKDPLHVPSETMFTTKITVQPLNIQPGLYGVPIHIKRTGTNELKKALLYMEVTGTPTTTTYLPAIRGIAAIPGTIDPREDIVITISLENQNRRNLSSISIKARSNVINQDFEANLNPLERKTFKFIAQIDPRTPPQRDVLLITAVTSEADKGYQFDLPQIEYEIKPYGQLSPEIQTQKSLLKTDRTITLTNNANILLEEDYYFPLSWTARTFTKTTPKARVQDGQLGWTVKLNVGNSMELHVVTNYRPIAALIILAGIILALYYAFRSPILVKKTAGVISTREGGISELKILLEIKNRTGKPVNEATIMDMVPRIAELIKDHDIGTLAPTKITKHERKGTLIKYEVGDILPYEERLIAYRIRSSLSILGGVSLPVAVAKFKTSAGKERSTTSNTPKVRMA
jgi:hypothetical protein